MLGSIILINGGIFICFLIYLIVGTKILMSIQKQRRAKKQNENNNFNVVKENGENDTIDFDSTEEDHLNAEIQMIEPIIEESQVEIEEINNHYESLLLINEIEKQGERTSENEMPDVFDSDEIKLDSEELKSIFTDANTRKKLFYTYAPLDKELMGKYIKEVLYENSKERKLHFISYFESKHPIEKNIEKSKERITHYIRCAKRLSDKRHKVCPFCLKIICPDCGSCHCEFGHFLLRMVRELQKLDESNPIAQDFIKMRGDWIKQLPEKDQVTWYLPFGMK